MLSKLSHLGTPEVFCLKFIYFERDREGASGGRAEREGIFAAGLQVVSAEPDAGLDLTKL